jgi:hypothetical protein
LIQKNFQEMHARMTKFFMTENLDSILLSEVRLPLCFFSASLFMINFLHLS